MAGFLSNAADRILESQLRKQARDLHQKIISMGFGSDRMKQGMAVFVDEFCVLTGSNLDFTVQEIRAFAADLAAKREGRPAR
jgi:hypothetical protein